MHPGNAFEMPKPSQPHPIDLDIEGSQFSRGLPNAHEKQAP